VGHFSALGFAWAPKQNEGRIVISGGAGIYFDRGELFSYLSQPFGAAGGGGVFGVTQAAPLAIWLSGAGKSLRIRSVAHLRSAERQSRALHHQALQSS
jgi:hypothetical protein